MTGSDAGYTPPVSAVPSNPGADQLWTTRRLLAWIGDALKKKGIESARLCAEILVSHVIACDKLKLYTDPDRPASVEERERLRDLVGRALKHEPVQYLVGEWWFFGLPLKVDRRVLIPRPSTETIVEHVLQHARKRVRYDDPTRDHLMVADVGTGSGCIAIALAKNMERTRVLATDVSAGALEVARGNAARHKVGHEIEFAEGDLLGPVEKWAAGAGLDYLVSNPPYIPDTEWNDVPANVKDYEPESALRGGVDGMRFVRPLLERGPELLRPGGVIAVEVAMSMAGAAEAILAGRDGVREVRVLKDVEGLPRVVVGTKR